MLQSASRRLPESKWRDCLCSPPRSVEEKETQVTSISFLFPRLPKPCPQACSDNGQLFAHGVASFGKGSAGEEEKLPLQHQTTKGSNSKTNFRYVLKWSLRAQLHEKRVRTQVTNTIYLVLPLPEPQIGSPLWRGDKGD